MKDDTYVLMALQTTTSPVIRIWKLTSSSLEEYFLPVEPAADLLSLNLISARLPEGAYTTFRTYAGRKVLRLSQHIDRLSRTAALGGFHLTVDESRIRAALRFLLSGPATVDRRLRITLDLTGTPGDLYISLEDLPALPEQAYRQGANAVTCRMRRADPGAKRTQFIAAAEQVRRGLPAEVEEAILLGPAGEMLEGLSSNFYAVRSGQVWTAGEGVLPGVTRSLLLACLGQCSIQVNFEPVLLGEVTTLNEMFITSSSREVMPVVKLDETLVGDGLPGPLTRQLMTCFSALVIRELEEI